MKSSTLLDAKNVSSNGIGVYWGTFDPPTLAHGKIIENSIKNLNLSKLIIVVIGEKRGINYD